MKKICNKIHNILLNKKLEGTYVLPKFTEDVIFEFGIPKSLFKEISNILERTPKNLNIIYYETRDIINFKIIDKRILKNKFALN